MSNATLSDLMDRIPQGDLVKLLNDTPGGTWDQATQDRAQRFLDEALDDIEEILAGKAATILSIAQLSRHEKNIAAFNIVSRRASAADKGLITVVKLHYERSVDDLKALARSLDLTVGAGTVDTSGLAIGAKGDSRTPTYTDDALKKF